MAKDIQLQCELAGLKDVQAKMEEAARQLHGQKMVDGMRKATLIVQRAAKIKAPVNTGRLRASIVPEIRVQGKNVTGIVGSNVKYAPYVELGTRPHWPPKGALAVWARRHGMSEYAIRKAIGTRGTKAVKFLRGAYEESLDQIKKIIGDAVGGIIKGGR